jgi:hypothetical protein
VLQAARTGRFDIRKFVQLAKLYAKHDAQLLSLVRRRVAAQPATAADVCFYAWAQLLDVLALERAGERWTARRGAKRVGFAPCSRIAAAGYVNLNFAVWLVPSVSVTVRWRQVPAHALSVFQTYLYWSLPAS